MQKSISESEQKINNLEERLNMEVEKTSELNKKIKNLILSPTPESKEVHNAGSEQGAYVQLVAPNGGESFCLGDTMTVTWKNNGVKSVEVYLTKTGTNSISYPLGTFPSNFNETGKEGEGLYLWTIGETEKGTVQEAFSYEILIKGNIDPYIPDKIDRSENVFSILDCRG